MNWIQIKVDIKPEMAEALEESFLAAGAAAVTLQDAEDTPVYEPELGTTPLWEHTIATALFSGDEDIDEAKKIIQAVYHSMTDQDCPSLRTEILENEDWTRKWIDNFKPIQFGEKLWVCPSWCDIPDPGAVNLLLDPGLAFGTGTHPTTSLCLKWLDQAALSGKQVVDFGCGSGVLGIAGLLLGAAHVVAIDNDPQALTATLDNANRNQIQAAQLSTHLPENTPEIEADIVVANILAQPLFELRDNIVRLTKLGGEIVLSGILAHQAENLHAHYAELLDMSPIVEENGWIRLHGIKR